MTTECNFEKASGILGVVLNEDSGPVVTSIIDSIGVGLSSIATGKRISFGLTVSYDGGTKQASFHDIRDMGQLAKKEMVGELDMIRWSLAHVNCNTRTPSRVQEWPIDQQPIILDSKFGRFSITMLGRFVNSQTLKKNIISRGVGLSLGSDLEILGQTLCYQGKHNSLETDWLSRIRRFMRSSPLGYSFLLEANGKMYAVRDPYGTRTLSLGLLIGMSAKKTSANSGCQGYAIATETRILSAMGCVIYRDVCPGEIVEISRDGGFLSAGVVYRPDGDHSSLCTLEYGLFAEASSWIEGQQVDAVRMRLGKQLAIECSVPSAGTDEVILVVPLKKSSRSAACGFVNQSPNCRLMQMKNMLALPVEDSNTVIFISDRSLTGKELKLLNKVELIHSRLKGDLHILVAMPKLMTHCRLGRNVVPMQVESSSNSVTNVMHLSLKGFLKGIEEGISQREVNNIGHCVGCLTGRFPGNQFTELL